jgi:ketosteroid isomerase-like protein
MSQENIEKVRRFYERWSARDFDGVLGLVTQDVEIDWSESQAPFQGVYTGRDGVLQFWKTQTDTWETFHVELIEAIECGPDCLIAVTRVKARGRGGIAVEAGGAGVWRLRDGAIAGVKLFQDKADALEAVSLSEQDG